MTKMFILDDQELKRNYRLPVFKGNKFQEYKYFKVGELIVEEQYRGDFEQCIGMKDKNGNPIYVGDILKVDNSDNVTVQIIEYGIKFLFCLFVDNKPIGFDIEPLNSEAVEIIGNHYENPELCQSSENKTRI